MPQEFSAGIVAFRGAENPKFLLLKYPKGYWGFSRGNIEPGEDSRTAAIRELKEETNLEPVKVFEGFKEIVGLFYRKECKKTPTATTPTQPATGEKALAASDKPEFVIVHKDITFYLAEVNDEEVKLTEHPEFGWFSFEEAMNKLQFKNDKELLKKVEEFLANYLKK